MTRIQGPHGDETESWVNQRRDEPLPTSHHDDPDQEAVARNEEHAGARPATGRPEAARPEAARPEAARPDDGPGKAVRDMMPGPAPQGDVPDAPGVQVAAAEDPGRDDDRPGPVRSVGNAVPGRPDGEVDTRP
jgi:hypothetical protein